MDKFVKKDSCKHWRSRPKDDEGLASLKIKLYTEIDI